MHKIYETTVILNPIKNVKKKSILYLALISRFFFHFTFLIAFVCQKRRRRQKPQKKTIYYVVINTVDDFLQVYTALIFLQKYRACEQHVFNVKITPKKSQLPAFASC